MNNNSELANIGTPQQYSKYLDTIFPDSKVKDIVYHGTNKEFDKFKKPSDVGRTMTTREIRAELVELINGGMLNVPKLVKFFKTHRPTADIRTVTEEAKELVAEIKLLK